MKRKIEDTLIMQISCKEGRQLVKISISAMKKHKNKGMNFSPCIKNKNKKKITTNKSLHNQKLIKIQENFLINLKKY